MSNLSGYDSEAVGFESVSRQKTVLSSSGVQTTEFAECGTGCQTTLSKDCGCSTAPDDGPVEKEPVYPAGLNEFLQRVMPAMMDQLDQNQTHFSSNSSDEDDEETLTAKLFQELKVRDELNSGGGDHSTAVVLALSWSSSGNSLAVALGHARHEGWCDHDGLVRVYTAKRAAGDQFVHSLDISEKSCVTALKYHPTVTGLLAYGTICGKIVACNLQDPSTGMQLASPPDCHGSIRVTALHWADPALANYFLTLQIMNKGRRRNAADQILISSGSDGSVNVWQVNANQRTFENVVTYSINGTKKTPPPDITCFDFIKTVPLRPSDEKVADDYFVVGTVSGQLFLCKTKGGSQVTGGAALDPVVEVMDAPPACIMDVAFSHQRPGVFASISIDSELRVYDIHQTSPVRVLCLDVSITCMCWVPGDPRAVLVGTGGAGGSGGARLGDAVRMYDVVRGKRAPLLGLAGDGAVTALAVTHDGGCRVAAGDCRGRACVWQLPARPRRLHTEDLLF